MTGTLTGYEELSLGLRARGHDLDALEQTIAALQVETPSWGFGDSGTRFASFRHDGRPRDVFERIEDAAKVNELTAASGAVALHVPWDGVDDLSRLRDHLESLGLEAGAVNPNLFEDSDFRNGSLA